MGKKKFDKHDFNRGLSSSFYGPGKKARKLLERYNVKGAKSAHPDGRSGPARTVDDVKRDLREAMNNDYDTRRTIEAAALAGEKGAKKLAKKGFDNPKHMVKGMDLLEKLKKKYVGGGGMRGSENEAGLTYAMVKNDRDKLKGFFDEKYGNNNNSDSNSDETDLSSPSLSEAILNNNISKSVMDASDRIQDEATRRSSGKESASRYDDPDAMRDDGYTQGRAFNFLQDYKLDLANRYGK